MPRSDKFNGDKKKNLKKSKKGASFSKNCEKIKFIIVLEKLEGVSKIKYRLPRFFI